jgi:hypothetical protein
MNELFNYKLNFKIYINFHFLIYSKKYQNKNYYMYLLQFIIFLPYIINQSNLKLVFLLKRFKNI